MPPKPPGGWSALSGHDSCVRHLLRALHEKAPQRSRPRPSSASPVQQPAFPGPSPPHLASFAARPKALTGSHVVDVGLNESCSPRSLARLTTPASGRNLHLPQGKAPNTLVVWSSRASCKAHGELPHPSHRRTREGGVRTRRKIKA